MKHKIKNFLMTAGVVMLFLGFTACSSDDNNDMAGQTGQKDPDKEDPEPTLTPKEEFIKLVDTGIANTKYEGGFIGDQETIDSFLENGDISGVRMEPNYFEGRSCGDRIGLAFDKENFFILDAGITVVPIRDISVEEEGDEFIIKVPEDASYKNYDEVSGKRLVGEGWDDLIKMYIIRFNTKNKLLSILISITDEEEGINLTILDRFAGTFYDLSCLKDFLNDNPKENKSTRSIESAMGGGVFPSDAIWTKVELKPISGLAKLAYKQLHPYGNHHVKFTNMGNGNIRMQFSDASGNASGNAKADYKIPTNHFWNNQMPMALNLYDVYFHYDEATGKISQGHVEAKTRPNDNDNGFNPLGLGALIGDQNSGSKAKIITTTGNSVNQFEIEAKLDFKLNFHLVIAKN